MKLLLAIWAVTTIFALLAWRLHAQQAKLLAPHVSFERVLSHCLTGDIILFRYHTTNTAHTLVTPFSHIALVLRVDGVPFLLESHQKGDTKHMNVTTGGVHVYSMEGRISMYQGDVFYMPLSRQFRNPKQCAKRANTILNRIKDYYEIPFVENYISYFVKNLVKPPDPKMNGMFCSEFLCSVFKDMKFVPQRIDCRFLTPESFIYIKHNNVPVYEDVTKIIHTKPASFQGIKGLSFTHHCHRSAPRNLDAVFCSGDNSRSLQ
jgi:hypothetical protein